MKINPLTKADSTVFFCFKTLTVAICREVFNHIFRGTMQYVADGVMACDVLYLTSAEFVSHRQNAALLFVQTRYHLVPHVYAGFDGGFLKLDFIEEAALESLVHVLGEICGGNEQCSNDYSRCRCCFGL